MDKLDFAEYLITLISDEINTTITGQNMAGIDIYFELEKSREYTYGEGRYLTVYDSIFRQYQQYITSPDTDLKQEIYDSITDLGKFPSYSIL